MLSPGCREASRLQSEALDQPLSLPQRLGLRLHLLICKWCRRYAATRPARRVALRHCPPFVSNSSANTKPLQWLHDELEDGAHSLAN